jgi:hypothetical protein
MLRVEICNQKAMRHPSFVIKKFPPMKAGIFGNRPGLALGKRRNDQ